QHGASASIEAHCSVGSASTRHAPSGECSARRREAMGRVRCDECPPCSRSVQQTAVVVPAAMDGFLISYFPCLCHHAEDDCLVDGRRTAWSAGSCASTSR